MKQNTNKIKFTNLEIAVLKKLFNSSAGNGHDFGFTEDARSVVKNPRELAGIISSLVKKNVIDVWEPTTTDSGTFVQFTWAQTGDESELHSSDYKIFKIVEQLVK
jgi:hypothetical protein